MNLLFVDDTAINRSETACHVFNKQSKHNAKFAGLDEDSFRVINDDMIRWSDIIFVMEHSNRMKIRQKYHQILAGRKIVCLCIPKEYGFMDKRLVNIFKNAVPQFLNE